MSSKPLLLMLVGMLYAIGRADAQAIESLLKTYDSKVPQEKIYIHFDNSLYTPGQTVWYKAYVLKGNEPSDLSKNLYIDWFDEKGKFVDRVIAPIVGSTASGSFTVPKKYPGAQLQVLAYTKWMLNFDSAFLFHKSIPVAQVSVSQTAQTTVAPVTTLRFFPEGGDMVENISSPIAFKAQNQGGIPADVKGVITTKNGQAIAAFTSVHNGMGKFLFTPLPGETYTAQWTDAAGNKRYTSLPAAKSDGIILSINADPANPEFSIERIPKADERFKKITMLAQMNQRIVFRAGVDLSVKTKVNSFIPVKNLPSGILQVTLLDAMHQPLAERIVFINNDNYHLDVDIHTDTVNLNRRGKNVCEVDVPDSIATSLSLAVTDGAIVADTSAHIVSQLLLSGEIKGYVHDPAYYFSSSSDSGAALLDLVMLTNGWRRFKWEDVWAGKTPLLNYAPDTSYLSIHGKINGVTDRQAKKAASVNMILMAKDSSRQYIFTPLHEDGSFGKEGLIFFDTTKLFYQLNNSSLQGKNQVTIFTSLIPKDSMRMMAPLHFFISDTVSLGRIRQISSEQRRVDSLKNKTTLSEVTVTAKHKTRMEQLDDRYATGQFSGHSTTIYEFNVIDDEKANTGADIFDYLTGKVPGLVINTAQRIPTAKIGRKNVEFLLDEQEILPPRKT